MSNDVKEYDISIKTTKKYTLDVNYKKLLKSKIKTFGAYDDLKEIMEDLALRAAEQPKDISFTIIDGGEADEYDSCVIKMQIMFSGIPKFLKFEL